MTLPTPDTTSPPVSSHLPTTTPGPAVSTSIPDIDDRFGIIASGPARDWQVQNLNATWFIDFNSDPGDAPPGTNKVPFIQVAPRSVRIPPADLAVLTARAEGSYWYIGGEPNVAAQGNMTPEAFVDEFDYYATEIRLADPTAKIMGPSILNWDFTCTGCGGFTSGETWMRSFIDAYAVRHGGKSPPVDVWSIDAYPLTWDSVPMTNWQLIRDQILGFRHFLTLEVPGHERTPIWVTELASHWAFSEWEIQNNALAVPDELDIETDYLWFEMEGYMNGILDWLKNEGPVNNIERWFFYKGHVDIEKSSKEGYAGIYFYEDASEGSDLNPLGKVYRDYILQGR
ncbi:MAG: glycosyl hydrolase [Dehalococcoidia bacterium]